MWWSQTEGREFDPQTTLLFFVTPLGKTLYDILHIVVIRLAISLMRSYQEEDKIAAG